jgi:hypothetical protein
MVPDPEPWSGIAFTVLKAIHGHVLAKAVYRGLISKIPVITRAQL